MRVGRARQVFLDAIGHAATAAAVAHRRTVLATRLALSTGTSILNGESILKRGLRLSIRPPRWHSHPRHVRWRRRRLVDRGRHVRQRRFLRDLDRSKRGAGNVLALRHDTPGERALRIAVVAFTRNPSAVRSQTDRSDGPSFAGEEDVVVAGIHDRSEVRIERDGGFTAGQCSTSEILEPALGTLDAVQPAM